jgi:tetratricopeptide (TPR) repeat protein
VRAIAAAVRLLTISRDTERIQSLTTIVNSIHAVVDDPYDLLHVLLAEAWTLTASHRSEQALARLQEGVNLAAERGFKSSIAVRLLIGLGNTLAVLGRYGEAIAPLSEAESMALQLDNETLMAECSTQLATAFGRLGERMSQIDWARRAFARFPAKDWSPGAIGARYELGMGLALEGRSAEARTAAVDMIQGMTNDHAPWQRQASCLCAADILALAGYPSRAIRHARSGIQEGGNRLLNESYAGQFARWTALLAAQDSVPQKGLRTLIEEFPEPRVLHAKDRTEYHAAKAYLLQKVGINPAAELRTVRDGLELLPPGVGMTIRGFGLHPDQQL